MKTNLPKFEGRPVEAASLRLSGKSQERVGSLALGEEVYVIVKATIAKISHGDASEVFTRQHDARAVAVVIVDRKDGERWLSEAAMLADERFGIQNLFGPNGELREE
jgi:hypothetical protein